MDCKFCASPLARDNQSGVCYKCSRYLYYVEQQTTEWLEMCYANPPKYMHTYRIKIIKYVLDEWSGK